MALNASSRATRRSSRANTPRARPASATTTPKISVPSALSTSLPQKARPQNTLDSWVEPPPPNPRPSFEDHGFERQGVLQHMEPLGTPPSAKLKAKLRGDAQKRPVFMNGLLSRDDNTRDSPDTLASGPVTREASARPEDTVEADTEIEASEEPAVTEPVDEVVDKTVQAAKNTEHPQPLLSRFNNFGKIVDRACEEARDNSDVRTNVALQKMYENSAHDSRLIKALDGILARSATPAQTAYFKRTVRKLKQQAKARESPPKKRLRLSLKMSKEPAPTPAFSPPKVTPQIEPTRTPRTTRALNMSSSVVPSSPASVKASASKVTRTLAVNDSDSDLSDVDETIAQGPPPDAVATNGTIASTEATTRPKRMAAPKGALLGRHPPVSKTRAGKRVTDDGDLSEATETEDHAEIDAIYARRKERLRAFDDVKFSESSYRLDPKYRPRTPLSNSLPPRSNGLVNGQQASNKTKASDDDDDDLSTVDYSSPPSKHFPRLGAPTRKKGLRTMISSPNKNKTKAVAGQAPMTRSGGIEGPSADGDLSDDEEVCAACGGIGLLISCDKCTEWFHFTCAEPPVEEKDLEGDENWWCSHCVMYEVRPPGADEPREGLFARLIDQMEWSKPMTFSLPERIREFFEDVKTGPDGEYEEEGVWIRAKNRHGYIESEDLTKLKDKSGVILCAQCGKSSLDGRPMLQCQVCQEHWHMDCCDPPLAVPPSVNHEWTKRQAFKCPRHVNRDLKAIEPKSEHVIDPDSIPINGRRTHRLRKPKNPVYVDPALRRGYRNNGVIEVVDDSSDDSEFYDEPSGEEEGQVLRLPVYGIKLDFIHAAKLSREKRQKLMQPPTITTTPSARPPHTTFTTPFAGHTMVEQQTALNLIQLAQKEDAAGLTSVDVDSLIMALLAEAPEQVVAQLTRAQSNLTNGTASAFDKLTFLTRLEEVIKQAKEQLSAQVKSVV
ncbi:hypothetical protein EJ05DRAFT_483867 [Pseudovirgaria hyperparasitica]|uniref:PHD-type domain-containing protein n=1 Tax=Pseudovirgaria hyperparasitica TaxID=470096 RepID=A0A6A6WG20_9PEZI|nr:uncharacterized protein EJ05DRAFT_483867 [Pseudovirgaria hyperparasitica]KAF2760081.1 hypothetical protein EJ05DRAFT_483867 [Pseudovirgaria hyperparasitica]